MGEINMCDGCSCASRSQSIREMEWRVFCQDVSKHIGEYTVPQYGDAPDDQVHDWTPEDCILAIRKYVSRYGSNMRKGEELLDLIKIAHYAQIAYTKLRKN